MGEAQVVVRNVGRDEPAKLGDVVVRLGCAFDDARRPVQIERRRGRPLSPVLVHPHAEELERLDLDAGLLTQLPAHAVERVLLLVEEPAREVPFALERLDSPPGEQNTPLAVEADGAGGGLRARVRLEPALAALDLATLWLDLGTAARTVLPRIQLAHVRNNRPHAAFRHSDGHRARAHRALPRAPR